MSQDADIVNIIDLSSLGSVTGTQLNQVVNTAQPSANKCLTIVSSASPDLVSNPRYSRFLWLDISVPTAPVLNRYDSINLIWVVVNSEYFDAHFEPMVVAQVNAALLTIQLITAQLADRAVTPPKTNFDGDSTRWGDPYRVLNQLPVNDLITRSFEIDIRAFGADPSGIIDSAPAFRLAEAYRQANGGILVVKSGSYLFSSFYTADTSGVGSKPFGFGGSLCYRDQFYSCVPLGDNCVIKGENATIKMGANLRYDCVLFSSLGFSSVTIDGLNFDGQRSLQTSPTYDGVTPIVKSTARDGGTFPGADGYIIYAGPGSAIMLGNKGIVKNCKFTNFAGLAPIPSDSAYSNINQNNVQYSISYGEPFLINTASNCEVYNCTFENSWSEGLQFNGSNNYIHHNKFLNIAGIGIAGYMPRFAYAKTGVTGGVASQYLIFMYLNNQNKYKGIKIGTVTGLATTFFGTNLTTAQLNALSAYPSYNNYDYSVYNYYAINNIISDNEFVNIGTDAIHLEQSLGTIVRNNKITQGIPKIQCEQSPLPVISYPATGSFSVLSNATLTGVLEAYNSMDTSVENNDFITDPTLVIYGALNQKADFCAINFLGYSLIFGAFQDYAAITYPQTTIQENFIVGNRVLQLNQGFNYRTPSTNLFAGFFNPTTFPAAIGLADNTPLPQDTSELVVQGDFNYPCISCDPVLCLRGSIKLTDIQDSDGSLFSKLSYILINDGTHNYIGTKRPMFRAFVLRAGTTWRVAFDVIVTKSDDITFYSRLKGVLVFNCTSGGPINVIDTTIELLDFRNGSIEIDSDYNNLLPGNAIRPIGRVISNPYRGGIRFYFHSYDSTLFGYTSNSAYAINKYLVFNTEVNITEV